MATSRNRFPSQIWHQEGPKRNGSPVEAFERGGGAKEAFRKHREQLQKTGGGPAPPKIPELSLIIKEISPTTFMQIQNAYDDDVIHEEQRSRQCNDVPCWRSSRRKAHKKLTVNLFYCFSPCNMIINFW